MKSTVMLYTENTIADCIERGGVCWWTIGERRANTLKYAILVQKGGINDKKAMAIVKIDGWVKQHGKNDNRILLKFSEYKDLSNSILCKSVWSGQRNPVNYVEDDTLGIDSINLSFSTVVKADHAKSRYEISSKMENLSITELKELLARKYDVTADKITITIAV